MSNPITPEHAYLLALAQRSVHAPESQNLFEDTLETAKDATGVAQEAVSEVLDMRETVSRMMKLSEEVLQQRNWAMESLEEMSVAYYALQQEHEVTANLLDTMTYAHANSIKESQRSDLRNERHIAKLSREITFMQRKLNKRRNRINHLQEVIGTILKERPIVTDYDKMGSAALGRVVHTLSEKYREVCRREKEEAEV